MENMYFDYTCIIGIYVLQIVQVCLTDKSTHYPLGMIVRPDDSVKERATYVIIASDYVHRVILGWYSQDQQN